MTIKYLSLYELNSLVQSVVEATMPDEYWVVAELLDVREVRGHCYMELVEKDDVANTPIARASAKCWASRWAMLRPMFERITGQSIRSGMKVMLKVHAQFHAAYGFSWIVSDINPEYTMGDLQRRRQEIIRRLKADGVFDLQRGLALSPFAQSVAVVSSDGAAGYGDFVRQLHDNPHGYTYNVELFAATMQGESVERSVIGALDRIYSRQDEFDVVVVIRGGGSTSDLSGFDTLSLAENVANFPLPIITGIGHDRDESILDLVAYTHVKTPTAAAQLLIDNLAHTDACIVRLGQRIASYVSGRMERERMRVETLSTRIPVMFSLVRERQTARVDTLARRMEMAVRSCMERCGRNVDALAVRVDRAVQLLVMNEKHRMQMLCQRVEAANPERLLERGYSITTLGGRAVRDASTLPDGAVVETRVANGRFCSVVTKGGDGHAKKGSMAENEKTK